MSSTQKLICKLPACLLLEATVLQLEVLEKDLEIFGDAETPHLFAWLDRNLQPSLDGLIV